MKLETRDTDNQTGDRRETLEAFYSRKILGVLKSLAQSLQRSLHRGHGSRKEEADTGKSRLRIARSRVPVIARAQAPIVTSQTSTAMLHTSAVDVAFLQGEFLTRI